MRRREFITLLGGAAVWPLLGHAEQAQRKYRIGILDINSAKYSVPFRAAFRDGLRRLGYVESQNIQIDYRASDGDTAALTKLARELVALKSNVILAASTSPVKAVKGVAPSMPVVCPTFGDAFVPALAESFAHPGGSVTGIASIVEGLFGKLTEIALDIIPGTSKIGFLANPAGASTAPYERQTRSTAQARGIAVEVEPVATLDDIEGALRRLSAAKAQTVIVPGNGLLHTGQKRMVELALALRMPLFFTERTDVAAGGLASYGISIAENYRRAAAYVDKILRGAAPGDLPIEFPTKIELVINLKIAKLLGLTVPPTVLVRADEVIE